MLTKNYKSTQIRGSNQLPPIFPKSIQFYFTVLSFIMNCFSFILTEMYLYQL